MTRNYPRVALNKKGPINFGPDVATLSTLSKFALLDLLVESLRLRTGNCDAAVNAEDLAEMCNPTLAARGDKILKGATR